MFKVVLAVEVVVVLLLLWFTCTKSVALLHMADACSEFRQH